MMQNRDPDHLRSISEDTFAIQPSAHNRFGSRHCAGYPVGDGNEVARVARAHWALNPSGGLILARPPDVSLELDDLIADAVRRVQAAGVAGQAVTPAVLALVEELSEGRSVEVNRALIVANARLAAEIAVACAALG